jgi:hypothetical protein
MEKQKIKLKQNNKKKFRLKFKPWYIYIIIVLIILSVLTIWVWTVNKKAKSLDKYSEVTFVSPTQAIIFWQSEEETLGYVKYGNSKWKLNQTNIQTSSEPGTIHVVFIENIPLGGIYISKRNEKGNILVFPQIEHIKYDSNQLNNE